jgi:hypothetical protein
MTKKIVSAIAVLIGAGSMVGCSNEQPTAGCITQDSPSWSAVYKLVPGSVTGTNETTGEACDENSTAAKLTGDLIGVYKYSDPNNPTDTKLVLRPARLAALATADEGDSSRQNATGQFAGLEPDAATDLCSIPEFSLAEVEKPAEINPTTGAVEKAAVKRSYQFSNVQVYSHPAFPGTTQKGEIVYTEDGCSAKYTYHAMWPAIPCDPEGDPEAHPEETCGPGSYINQDYKTMCHPTRGLCVLDYDGEGSFPPFR